LQGEGHLEVDQVVRMGHLSQILLSLDSCPLSPKQRDHSGTDKTCKLQCSCQIFGFSHTCIMYYTLKFKLHIQPYWITMSTKQLLKNSIEEPTPILQCTSGPTIKLQSISTTTTIETTKVFQTQKDNTWQSCLWKHILFLFFSPQCQ